MTPKYHVNPTTGEAGQCGANVKCPFGDGSEHHNTLEAARQAFEAGMVIEERNRLRFPGHLDNQAIFRDRARSLADNFGFHIGYTADDGFYNPKEEACTRVAKRVRSADWRDTKSALQVLQLLEDERLRFLELVKLQDYGERRGRRAATDFKRVADKIGSLVEQASLQMLDYDYTRDAPGARTRWLRFRTPMDHEPRDNWVKLDKKQEQSVVANYRAFLRTYSRTRGASGPDKQAVLQVTADRYKLPISQVKSIVKQATEMSQITPCDYAHPTRIAKDKYCPKCGSAN